MGGVYRADDAKVNNQIFAGCSRVASRKTEGRLGDIGEARVQLEELLSDAPEEKSV